MNSLSIIDPAEKATSLSNMSSQVPLLQDMAAMGDIFTEKSKVFEYPLFSSSCKSEIPSWAVAKLSLPMKFSA